MNRTVIPFLLTGALSLGCQATFRSDTVVHDDGSVERAIYQPAGNTPQPAQFLKAWKQTTFAPGPDELEKQGFDGNIRSLPVHPSSKERPYFAAWGTFPGALALPDHLVVKAPEKSGIPDARLVRRQLRTDLVFVVEHRWRETLTDVVTLEDMHKARDEMVDLLLEVFAETFDEAVGQEYDATDLVKWAKTEGKAWLAELTDFAFHHCSGHKGPAAREALAAGLGAIVARHGLVFSDSDRILEGDALGRALARLAVDLMCKHVRHRKDRIPVDRKTAEAWVADWLSQGDQQPRLFGPAYEKVLSARCGGKEKFDRRTSILLIRIVGLHASDMLFRNQHFEYALTMPGEVVETNGQILGENRVRWEFGAREAYPAGYEMICRSLVPRVEVQKDLLGGTPMENREAMLEFVKYLDASEGMGKAIQECGKQKTVTPLYVYRQEMSQIPDLEEVKRVNRLLRLLRLPLNAPVGTQDGKR